MKEIKKVVAGDVKTPVVKTPVEVKAPVVNEVVAPDKKELKATIEAYKLVNPVKYEIKRKNGEFDRLLK